MDVHISINSLSPSVLTPFHKCELVVEQWDRWSQHYLSGPDNS
jgi:hypothetical protein